MAREKVITDNDYEKIITKWDGVRLTILGFYKKEGAFILSGMIILNPREMRDLIEFSGSCLKGG